VGAGGLIARSIILVYETRLILRIIREETEMVATSLHLDSETGNSGDRGKAKSLSALVVQLMERVFLISGMKIANIVKKVASTRLIFLS
jgi:hypothetical protein